MSDHMKEIMMMLLIIAIVFFILCILANQLLKMEDAQTSQRYKITCPKCGYEIIIDDFLHN